jgi:micrococcal nuclease
MEKYVYRADVVGVYDADTIDAIVDLGFGINQKMRFRLARINAPEVKGSEKVKGLIARDYVRDKILGREVIIKTVKDEKEKFGRYLAEVFYNNRDVYPELEELDNLSDRLVLQGMAIYQEY